MEISTVSFTPKDVMALRQKTGLGMMDCKEALAACNGDAAAAEQWLRNKLKGKMDARTERATGEGRIGIAIDGAKASIVEVRTETDFTARNESFASMVEDVAKLALKAPPGDVTADAAITKRVDDVRITTGENMAFARGTKLEGGGFGSYIHHDHKRGALIQVQGAAPADLLKSICQHIVAHVPPPIGVSEADVPAKTLADIRAAAIEEAKAAGKNESIAQKMAEGKARKYLEEHTLLHQKSIQDDSKAIKDLLPKGVTVTKFVRYTVGG
jgi:elongation factor Ts